MEHHFDVEDAVKYGVEKAVILYNLKFWITRNLANEKHRHDERTWTYNSAEAFAKLFPYFNAQKIARLLRQLEDAGVIVSGNYNLAGYDQTKWYAFVDEETVFQGQFSNLNNGIFKSEQPIPDKKPDKNKERGTYYVEPTSELPPVSVSQSEETLPEESVTSSGSTTTEAERKPGLFQHITTLWHMHNPAARLDSQDKELLREIIKVEPIERIDYALSTVWETDASKPPKWALRDFNWSAIKTTPGRLEIPTHRDCPVCGRRTTLSGGVCYGCGLELKDFDNEIVLEQMKTAQTGEEGISLMAEFRQKTHAVQCG